MKHIQICRCRSVNFFHDRVILKGASKYEIYFYRTEHQNAFGYKVF